MHVGFALLTLFPGRVGGSESNVRGLLSEFSRQGAGQTVTVLANRQVAASCAGHLGDRVGLHEVRTYRAGNGRASRLAAMLAAGAAPGLVARGVPAGIDVLHHPVTVPIPRLRGVPTVTTVYDLQHHELPQLFSRSERAFRRWAYDGAARSAAVTITTSEYSREQLVDRLGLDPGRVEAIPMGIDHGLFHPRRGDIDDRLAARLPARFVTYPANLWPHKNHGRLIDAMARVPDRDLKLVLTGDDGGRGAELAERARRAGVADRVIHLGYLARDELPALLRAARGMVFPSLYEGFGSPPLEAMACGCPVSAPAHTSLSETLGDAALPLEPTSVESIAAAIERLSDDRELRESLRRRGLERSQSFTWHAAARRHRAVYERCAATPLPAAH